MKKVPFYIRHKNGFVKVNGYMTTIKNNEDECFIIGFHRENYRSWWVATHIESGILICKGKTRKECYKNVNSEKIMNVLNEIKNRDDIKKYIEDMNKFLKDGVIN